MMTTQPSDWSNYDNAQFYSSLSIEDFKKIADLAGLGSCPDVELILPYLKPDSKILEIGAGYGRVLNYLLNKGFKNLHAIEREPKLCKLLNQQFGNKINLIQTDLHDFKTDCKYDVILWLWAGITEFAKEEQFWILNNTASFLKNNGIFMMDTLPTPIKLNDYFLYSDGNNSFFKYKNHSINLYFPEIQQIKNYSKKPQITHKYTIYKTSNNMQRIICVMQKS